MEASTTTAPYIPRSALDHMTPTPRHLSTQVEIKDSSYTTPPTTPPLAVDNDDTTQFSTPIAADTRPMTATAAVATTTTATASSATQQKEPLAWCTARARIPTPDGSEYFLHIYENRKDRKEHLAFVFGDAIRSISLDRVRPGETELDRIKRGAYTGRIRPVPAAQAATQVEDGWISPSEVSSAASTLTTPTSDATTADSDVDMTDVAGSTPFEGNKKATAPLVRIHSECFTGEIGHSARCDCGEQLDEAIRLMKAEGSGVVVYLRQEGRGIGLGEKLKAYNLQDLGYDTVMANLLLNHGADERTYDVAQAILEDLGLQEIRLLTNNPDKIEKVTANSSIRVVERVPMVPKSWEAIFEGREDLLEVKEGAVENKVVRGKELNAYLVTKVSRMRHMIDVPASFQ
ncbi:GTP cyclohydrolase II [Actinomortierella wolfii]|nr:GTP cyclohydrolase II [Actinomortierella wolfii]